MTQVVDKKVEKLYGPHGHHALLSHPHPTEAISVLIVDDSAFDRLRIRRLGEKSGLQLEISEVARLSDLETVLNQSVFDVVLLDYNLPEGNGLQALDILRANDTHANCPAIMVAGEERVSQVVDALRHGCLDYLAKKELTVDSLHSAIFEALKARTVYQREAMRLRADAADLVDRFFTAHLRGLKPQFQGMLSDIEQLRAKTTGTHHGVTDTLDLLETRILNMWKLMKATRSGKPLH